MNCGTFQSYMEAFRFEEVSIIGRDISIDDGQIHVVGMGRKKDGTYLYILEEQLPLEQNPVWKPDETKRVSLLKSADTHVGSALHISKIQIGEDTFAFQGGTGGNLAQMEYAEAYFFFQQMMEKGWRLSEDSPFYRLEWNCMGLAALYLKDSYETLPVLTGEIGRVTLGPTHKSYIIQKAVRLERGKRNQLCFTLEEGGEDIVCYINQVNMMEPLVEERKRFADAQYQEKALQHVTKEEFEEMKKMALSSIEADCPEGMGYFTVEYECTKENLSAQFYPVSYLDRVPESKKGGTAMLMMGGRPEQETGPHGFRNRCAVIQCAVPVATEALDAELFLLNEVIQEREIVL
ncbi:MAG: hypothetical protein K2I96_14675 [Lachnospiraceae bacterium]|nr:hypothetical protein [Lachnospiraceae bacterium]